MPSSLKPIESQFLDGSFLIGTNGRGCQGAEGEESGVASWLCLLLVVAPVEVPVPIPSLRSLSCKMGIIMSVSANTDIVTKPQSPAQGTSDGQVGSPALDCVS